jgi:Putative zinc-finger
LTCDEAEEHLSAQADGEPVDELRAHALRRHVASCPRCSEFATALQQAPSFIDIHRAATDGVADEVDDVARRVRRRVAVADRAASWSIARVLLAVVAIQVIVFSVPDLVASGDAAHAARHLGAFNLAYAAALLSVVHRPARARVVLPVSIVLGIALLISAVIDVADGLVPLTSEATHLPEFLSVFLVWRLAPRLKPPSSPVTT